MKLKNRVNNSIIDVPSEHGLMLIKQGVWEEVFIEKKEEEPVVEVRASKGPGRPRKNINKLNDTAKAG